MRSIKKLFDEQELVVGVTCQHVCNPWLAKLYRDAGTDFLFIENEHLMFNGADMANLVLAGRAYGLPVVAKCEYINRASITNLLDAGVTGIQLPMSETAEQLAEVVNYVKFPPLGVRAAASGVGSTDYEPVDIKNWLKETNEETTVIAHIESQKGVDNIDAILSVPGVDIMFIGVFDLMISLGQPAKFDHPDVIAAMDKLLDATRQHGKVAGMWAPSFEAAKPWIKKGVRFIEGVGEIDFIASGAKEYIKSFPDHGPRVKQGDSHI